MKKTIEIEYVGFEDVQEIFSDAYSIMTAGNYVSTSISGLGNGEYLVDVYAQKGELNVERPNDYSCRFMLTDDEVDVARMKSCKAALKKFLREWK